MRGSLLIQWMNGSDRFGEITSTLAICPGRLLNLSGTCEICLLLLFGGTSQFSEEQADLNGGNAHCVIYMYIVLLMDSGLNWLA